MSVSLVVRGGKHDGQKTRIDKQARYLIGRGFDCQLRIASDKISRHHCAIDIDEQGVVISDLGSGNGTYVNRYRVVEPCSLSNGDIIHVGPLVLEIVIGAIKKPTAKTNVLEEDIAQWIGEAGEGAPTSDTQIMSAEEAAELQRDLAGDKPRVPPPTAFHDTRNAASEALSRMKQIMPPGYGAD